MQISPEFVEAYCANVEAMIEAGARKQSLRNAVTMAGSCEVDKEDADEFHHLFFLGREIQLRQQDVPLAEALVEALQTLGAFVAKVLEVEP